MKRGFKQVHYVILVLLLAVISGVIIIGNENFVGQAFSTDFNKFSASKSTASSIRGEISPMTSEGIRHYVYALVLDTGNWKLKQARMYTQSPEATRKIEEYRSLAQE